MTIATNLNFIPGKDIPVIHISQNDRSTTVLRFYVYNGDSQYLYDYATTRFYIRGTKADGTTFNHIINKIRNEYIYYALQQDMTDVAGDAYCNIEMIENETNRTGSQAFILRIQPDAKGEM